MSTTKKKQHYVWSHYLDAWKQDDVVYWYSLARKEIRWGHPDSIAYGTYFYNIKDLSQADRAYIRVFISKLSNESLRNALNRLFNVLQAPHLYELKSRSGRNIPAGELSRMTEMIRDKYDKTIVEHWHGGIENRCTPILAALRNLDLTFWSDKEKCGVFLYFLTHQLFRTPKMKNAMSRLQFNNSVEGLDLKRIWAIDSLLFANVLGANL